jgi:hypothetical protein
LETWASKIRETKATIPGGQWQLEAFYTALAEPAVGSHAPDKEWRAHLNLFEEWTNSYPQSITANVSYARAMIGYAWYGRTGRWASNLTPAQSALFKERLAKARALLVAGTDLTDKCPEWFHATQMVALGEGWNRKDYMDVFNAAVRFEPTYGAYYYGLSTYLLPRWNGAEGEWQSVLANITESGSDEVLANYQRVFSLIVREYYEYGEVASAIKQYWPRLKSGYHLRNKIYKLQPFQINEYARMAYIAGDREEAREAFRQIGDRRDLASWEHDARFYEQVRDWAFEN